MERDEFKELSKLCRIECTEEESATIQENLGKVLGYVETLKDVPTTDIPPCYQVVHFPENVLGDDEVADELPLDEFLENVPDQIGGMVKTPKVIQF